MEYLHPERGKSVQIGNVSADPVPGLQIKKRAGTALLIQFFHHKECHGRRILIGRIHLKQDPQQLEAVRSLSEEILDLLKSLSLVSVKSHHCAQIKIGTCFFQFITCKLLALAGLEDFFGKTLVVLQISKISFKQMVFRIFVS